MFDRDLINYLPGALRNVGEFTAITNAVQPAVKEAWESLDRVMNNQFIDSADEDGISVWEKELGIVPLAADTPEDRKQRIKIAWAHSVVYTAKWLNELLVGYNRELKSNIKTDGYTVSFPLSISGDWRGVCDLLGSRIPANMIVSPVLTFPEAVSSYTLGTAVRLSVKRTITDNTLQQKG